MVITVERLELLTNTLYHANLRDANIYLEQLLNDTERSRTLEILRDEYRQHYTDLCTVAPCCNRYHDREILFMQHYLKFEPSGYDACANGIVTNKADWLLINRAKGLVSSTNVKGKD